jgi:membrane-bound lytic murein transglycosylase D
MTEARKYAAIISLFIIFIFACSHPDPAWTLHTPESISNGSLEVEGFEEVADTLKAPAAPDMQESFEKAEEFYAKGVHYYQLSFFDSAQTAYEQSLTILSELDLDPEQNPDEAARMERILNEIEEDYRLTLVASGTLSSEASITAFRELFSDLKNFKNLKETGIVKEFNKADTVIYDVDIEWNEKVENSLIYLQTVARNKFNTYLERSAAYLPMMEKIFKERGMPHDLVYLPLIESGFNASAYSYARASGFWQFISSTGKLYGLDHNWWFDERRDFEKSTIAAAEHMKDLYEIFGSWNLVLAAYNGGAGRVSREIKKAKTNDFWKLSLHSQTKAYVPLFMAATIIAKQPNKYGFFPHYQKPIEFDTIYIDKCVSFNNIANKTGIAVDELERLNPELLRGITPPKANTYCLRVPVGYKTEFAAIYNDLPAEKAKTMASHKVRKGETLSTIAKKYGTSVAAIIEVNGLSKKQRIYSGQLLTIPVPGVSYASNPEPKKSFPKDAIKKQLQENPEPRPNRYLVKHGDTLWEIAAAHGVSISDIRRLNNLQSSALYAGRWLKIPERQLGQPAKATIETVQATNEIYKVKRGDNLFNIATRFDVELSAIKEANNLTNNKLYPGMTLKIPTSGSSPAPAVEPKGKNTKELDTKVYTIRRGDTLWKIARQHGVKLNDLARWNNITTRSRLVPGDKLKIYL